LRPCCGRLMGPLPYGHCAGSPARAIGLSCERYSQLAITPPPCPEANMTAHRSSGQGLLRPRWRALLGHLVRTVRVARQRKDLARAGTRWDRMAWDRRSAAQPEARRPGAAARRQGGFPPAAPSWDPTPVGAPFPRSETKKHKNKNRSREWEGSRAHGRSFGRGLRETTSPCPKRGATWFHK
jgi:hypothetical protein